MSDPTGSDTTYPLSDRSLSPPRLLLLRAAKRHSREREKSEKRHFECQYIGLSASGIKRGSVSILTDETIRFCIDTAFQPLTEINVNVGWTRSVLFPCVFITTSDWSVWGKSEGMEGLRGGWGKEGGGGRGDAVRRISY